MTAELVHSEAVGHADPVGATEFAAIMERLGPFEARPRLAVAVSGGRDSMALAWLLQRWIAGRGGELVILTVDHNLRPEAADEAQRTAAFWQARGVAAHILTVTDHAPVSRIEETARNNRWQLLNDWCARHGVLHLFAGHHLNDQAETVLMRLAKSSGPDGLAAMREVSYRNGMRVLRPLLGIARARLSATCAVANLPVIDDPTNDDPRFLRAALRLQAATFRNLGLTAERLQASAVEQAAIADTINRDVAAHAVRSAAIDAMGQGSIDWPAFVRVPARHRSRILARMIETVGGRRYPLGREALSRLDLWLDADFEGVKGITLGGCQMTPTTQAGVPRIIVTREVAAIDVRPIILDAGQTVLWDSRFLIAAADSEHGKQWHVVPADNAIWRALKPDLPRDLVDMTARLRWSLPAVVEDGRAIGILAPGFMAAQDMLSGWKTVFSAHKPWLRIA